MDLVWAAETAAGESGSGYWHLALVLMGIGFLGVFARWRKKRHVDAPKTGELRMRDQEPNRYRDAADSAIVDLLETSRSLTAQVDNKIRILNRLVKDAETHCARLEQLIEDAKRLAEDGKPSPAVRAEEEDTVTCPPPQAKSFLSELHERVFLLSEEGKSVSEIAKATNLSTIEVRFALESMGDGNG